MEVLARSKASTVLYYNPERFDSYCIGCIQIDFGRMIYITNKRMREDLGRAFEVDYLILS